MTPSKGSATRQREKLVLRKALKRLREHWLTPLPQGATEDVWYGLHDWPVALDAEQCDDLAALVVESALWSVP